MGDEKLSDGSDVVRLETTMSHFGEKIDAHGDKVDKLVDGFNDFKLEVTRGFGELDNKVDLADQRCDSRSSTSTARLDDHSSRIDEAKETAEEARVAAAQAGGPSKIQAGGALGGAGVLGALMTKFLDYFTTGAPPH